MPNFSYELQAAIPALQRYARSLYYQPEKADDLVQDCLERALNKKHLWRAQPESSLRPWLFKLQYNLYINQIKKLSNQPPMIMETDHLHHHLDPEKSTVLMDDINTYLQHLPEGQRQVLLLVTIGGFTYEEVSTIMSIPLGTVMSRLSRARKRLQLLINGEPTTRPKLRSVK